MRNSFYGLSKFNGMNTRMTDNTKNVHYRESHIIQLIFHHKLRIFNRIDVAVWRLRSKPGTQGLLGWYPNRSHVVPIVGRRTHSKIDHVVEVRRRGHLFDIPPHQSVAQGHFRVGAVHRSRTMRSRNKNSWPCPYSPDGSLRRQAIDSTLQNR